MIIPTLQIGILRPERERDLPEATRLVQPTLSKKCNLADTVEPLLCAQACAGDTEMDE